MNQVKGRLKDYQEPVDSSLWQQLEEELLSTPSLPTRRFFLSRRAMASVAAVALLLIVSSLFLLLYSPDMDKLPAQKNALNKIAQQMTSPLPEKTITTTTQLASDIVAKAQSHPRRSLPVSSGTEQVMVTTSDKMAVEETKIESTAKDNEKSAEQPATVRSEKENSQPVAAHRNYSSNRYSQNQAAVPASRSHHPWSVGASLGSGGGSFDASQSSDMAAYNVLYSNQFGKSVMPLATEDLDHHQPISFGISIRKDLGYHLSAESGIVYTLLLSDVKRAGGSKNGKQQLHYIGIPIRGNWTFVSGKQTQLYLDAGGMVEKCIYAKRQSKTITINELQYSVNGGLGIQYSLTKRLGIYAETGVSYYFDDGSNVQTIRKDKPFNINFQAGLRLNY